MGAVEGDAADGAAGPFGRWRPGGERRAGIVDVVVDGEDAGVGGGADIGDADEEGAHVERVALAGECELGEREVGRVDLGVVAGAARLGSRGIAAGAVVMGLRVLAGAGCRQLDAVLEDRLAPPGGNDKGSLEGEAFARRERQRRIGAGVDAGEVLVAVPAGRRGDEGGAVGAGIDDDERARVGEVADIGDGHRERAGASGKADGAEGALGDGEIKLCDHRRWRCRRRAGGLLEDDNVADPGGVVPAELGSDWNTGAVDVHVGVDHVGPVRAGRRRRRARCRIGLERGGRDDLLEGGLVLALEAGNVGLVGVVSGGRIETGPIGRAKGIAGHPDKPVRLPRIDCACGGIAGAEGDAAGGAGTDVGRAVALAVVITDVVAADRLPDPAGIGLVAEHAGFVRGGKGILRREAEIAQAAALGKEHHRLVADCREGDVGDGIADAGAGDRLWRAEELRQEELAADARRVESAVLGDCHRPDGVLLILAGGRPVGAAEALAPPDRVVEADAPGAGVAAHVETPDAAAEVGKVPARRGAGEIAARTVGDPRRGRRVEGDRRQRGRRTGQRIGESRAAGDAVIVAAEIGTVGKRQTVDHAGLEIGDEELMVPAVEGDVAEGGAGVRSAVEGDRGEYLGLVVVGGGETIDRPRLAPWTPQAGHPIGIVGVAVQAESGRGGQVDARRIGIVERDAEHLTDIAGGDREGLRLIQPVAAVGGEARRAQIDGDSDIAGEVDDGARAARPVDGGRAGEFRDEGLAGKEPFLRVQARLRTEQSGSDKGENPARKRR